MPVFTSTKEKRLWIWAGAVVLAIFSTLVFGQQLAGLIQNQDINAAIFLLGMILIGLAVLFHGLRGRSDKSELVIWLGIAAVYMMVFLRLTMSERTHLIEYSVLAIFIHSALVERLNHENQIIKPALIAFLFTFTIGVIDESIQLFLPHRVFDPVDILFNGLAAFMALVSSMTLFWIRKKKANNKSIDQNIDK